MAATAMTGQDFFVLTALADGPRHGYGIVGEVAELSGDRVRLKIGSLYGVLERLTIGGLIEPERAGQARAHRQGGLRGGGMSREPERRYRRVLRLLPGWYRQEWESDMLAAFLDSRQAADHNPEHSGGSAARGPGPATTSSAPRQVRPPSPPPSPWARSSPPPPAPR